MAARPVLKTTAHPRSRGENSSMVSTTTLGQGSSPLTRGKLTFPIITRDGGGLIPAHAGKTIFQALLTRATGAHPRSRGENVGSRPPVGRRSGSSPLTRGKLSPFKAIQKNRRLIPAHAGKTKAGSPAAALSAAHPRSRGENPCSRDGRRPATGSSPLTRGKPLNFGHLAGHDGLIPAHAGKTLAAGV